jgi:hypothetical protein
MNDQKIVNCVQWKHDLYENAYKTSGARTFAEYIALVNAAVNRPVRPLPTEAVSSPPPLKRDLAPGHRIRA